ncbi:hypothetical protein EDEG_01665 [Edhazardia aedis USNM 41457]|uniref:Uncharacterized protein n=1 Tax=Edhazardia aedis (strain USNM 41457) TaxID=1003232 RepID=J9D8C8_EDHAE|nr:hypothetical protein EDEG_01665 [Edhazardia aedis USNM 41457]|eukprot:EJW04031.1 hypothetical protein EDEG_01665 [Edhazardia aedis USNM 41457]
MLEIRFLYAFFCFQVNCSFFDLSCAENQAQQNSFSLPIYPVNATSNNLRARLAQCDQMINQIENKICDETMKINQSFLCGSGNSAKSREKFEVLIAELNAKEAKWMREKEDILKSLNNIK